MVRKNQLVVISLDSKRRGGAINRELRYERGVTMLQWSFKIDRSAQQGMSSLEKQADEQLQILKQCEGDFRTVNQHIFPALMVIGNQNPDLIRDHVHLLSSERFLGSTNRLMLKIVLQGFSDMIDANPSFHSLVEQYARDNIEELARRVAGLNNREWMEVENLCKSVLAKLGVHPIMIAKQTHISSKKPFDHFEAVASLITRAQQEFLYVDPYVGDDLAVFLGFLRRLDGSFKRLRVLTREDKTTNIAASLETALRCFVAQGNSAELRYDDNKSFHDRWCIIDQTHVYNIGASLKGVAKGRSTKSFDIFQLNEPELSKVKQDINYWWQQARVII